jgi:hypothetical protein
MKRHVVFDEAGNVGVIVRESASGKQSVGFLLHEGQREATLDVPPELEHLKPRELHDSVRVDLKGGSPLLVAKSK